MITLEQKREHQEPKSLLARFSILICSGFGLCRNAHLGTFGTPLAYSYKGWGEVGSLLEQVGISKQLVPDKHTKKSKGEFLGKPAEFQGLLFYFIVSSPKSIIIRLRGVLRILAVA